MPSGPLRPSTADFLAPTVYLSFVVVLSEMESRFFLREIRCSGRPLSGIEPPDLLPAIRRRRHFKLQAAFLGLLRGLPFFTSGRVGSPAMANYLFVEGSTEIGSSLFCSMMPRLLIFGGRPGWTAAPPSRGHLLLGRNSDTSNRAEVGVR